MSLLTLIKPIVGKPDATEDVKLVNALTAIENWANGQIDHTNLSDTAGITEGQLANLAVGLGKLSAAVQTTLGEKGTGLVLTNKYSGFVKFSKEEALIGVEPSATRPAFVSLIPKENPATQVTVGGLKAGLLAFEAKVSTLIWVPPGQKWKVELQVEASTILL